MNLNIPMYTIHKYIGILGTLNLSNHAIIKKKNPTGRKML